MKITIADNIALWKGEKENELPNDSRIRFETEDYKIEIYFDAESKSITVYKLGKGLEDSIMIKPYSCNIIDIR